MDLEAWKVILTGAVLIANLVSMGAGYYAWTVGRRQARKLEVEQGFVRVHDRVEKVWDAHGELRDRVSSTEAALQHLPSAQTVTDLRLVVEELRGDVRALGKEMGGFKELSGVMRRQVELIDGYLRESGGRKT